jgi:hypothetical protein
VNIQSTPVDDLLEQLKAPFPKESHKARKLPGGSYYIYIPWDCYVDRLNQLLGLNWSISYSDPIVVGDYLSVRAQLTITSEVGITIRDGLGTTRTFPELNDEGKEKIIGDPPNNATREALRDACHQFGMGRYLDNQTEVCNLLQVKDPQTLYVQTSRPKKPGEISREQWQAKKAANQ